MKTAFEFNGQSWVCDWSTAVSLGIDVRFEGDQPNHFGAPRASRSALELGGFVGDTAKGGSCNVDRIQMIPHCNGTHTETVGHIVDQEVPVASTHIDSLTTATLLHVESELAKEIRDRGETYRPALEDQDRVICAAQLEFALHSIDLSPTQSLILATDTSPEKKSAAYSETNQPPFLTVEAMQLIVERKFQHLLVDIPSVDRMYDDGLLTNHHLFWNVPEGTHKLSQESWKQKTITEMVYVPAELESGFYLLNLQVPGFYADAAPSRPVIVKPQKV